ncbi:MAG: hypothetical protein AAF572_14425 [Cyanobacteria bacterium P01_B01_bin.77]
MITGTTAFQYLKGQPPNQIYIKPGHYYYQFRLHEVSAFFKASWLKNFDSLVLISEVTNTLHPDITVRSLHTVKAIERNQAFQLGIRTNLTNWLPARSTDSIKIIIKYMGIRSSPVKDLLMHLEQAGLVATLSALEPEWKVALKVSNVVGKLTSHLLQEGTVQELFSITQQFNVSKLKTGYYAAWRCLDNEVFPSSLSLNSHKQLVNGSPPRPVKSCSYVILQIHAIERLGVEILRHEPWWQLLQVSKDEIMYECELDDSLSPEKAKGITKQWQDTLRQVKKMLRADKGYLLSEGSDVIRAASYEVSKKLRSSKILQSFGLELLPTEWQHLLGVSTFEELQKSAENYQDALQWSQAQQVN